MEAQLQSKAVAVAVDKDQMEAMQVEAQVQQAVKTYLASPQQVEPQAMLERLEHLAVVVVEAVQLHLVALLQTMLNFHTFS